MASAIAKQKGTPWVSLLAFEPGMMPIIGFVAVDGSEEN